MTEVTKLCNNCQIILNDDNMVKGRNQCKPCRSAKYKEYVKTKLTENYNVEIERTCSKCSIKLNLENTVKRRPMCKDCYNVKCNEYKKNNKAKVQENHKEYYEKNKETIAEYYKDHYKENKDTYMANNRKWRQENRETINEKANERFRTNSTARLIKNARTRISKALKGQSIRSIKLIDCNIQFLKDWLQSNFNENMTLENYGTYWHMDHVIPCSHFDLTNEDEIRDCFRWTNLQPMLASENICKQDTLNKTEVKRHYNKVKAYSEKHNITLKEFNYIKYF